MIVTVNNGEFLKKNNLRNCDGEFAVHLNKALGLRKFNSEFLQHALNVTVYCSQFLQHSLSNCDGELQ